jgi:hypothetical protein
VKLVRLRIFGSDNSILKEKEFREFPIEMGRSAINDFRINDESCSKSHCKVEMRGEEFWFTDRNSTNGSFSDQDERISEFLIEDSFRFRIGMTWIEIAILDKLPELLLQDDLTTAIPKTAPTPMQKMLPVAPLFDLPPPPAPSSESFHAAEPPVLLETYTAAPKWAEMGNKKDIGYRPTLSRKPDEIDAFISSTSGSKFTLLALIFILMPLGAITPGLGASEELPKKALICFGLVLSLAFIAAMLTLILAKIFRRTLFLSDLVHSYLIFFSCLQFLYFLSGYSQALWPESNPAAMIILATSLGLCGIYLLFNLRWVGGFGRKTILGSAFALTVSLIYGLSAMPVKSPSRWKTITAGAEMKQEPQRVPASIYVGSDQLLKEIGQSAEILTE